jgi:hypothetical protein
MNFVLKCCIAVSFILGMTGCQVRQSPPEKQEESETDGMEQAMIQNFKRTRDPQLNIIPAYRLEAAKQKAQAILSASRITALSWVERGPSNIGGRTRAMIVDSRDASGNTVLAASVSGGMFKTTNFTDTNPVWTPVNDKLQNLAVCALIQDHNNPNTMYAGTGEGYFNIDAVPGVGIFKSTDGGTTWSLLPSTTTFEYVQDLIIDNNGNVYASLRPDNNATSRGVVRSTNGGTTWTQVLGIPLPGFTTSRAADLELASNGDLYATLGIHSRTQVMKSNFSVNGANTGAVGTWAEITPVHTAPTKRGEIAVAPSNPLRLYLMMEDSATSQVKTLYRSSDAGSTWDSLPAPSAVNNGNISQTWFNLISAVDPNNPDVVVVGGYHVAKSTDAGLNFTNITAAGVHVDQHVLHFRGSANLIVGNDGGYYYSTNANTAGINFSNKNNGFNVTQFYGVDFHPTNPNYFLAGAQDNNTQKFTTAGLNATFAVVGGDGGFPHIDQTDGQIQIASTTGNNFYRSLDGGTVWSSLSTVSNSRGQFIQATDYDDNLNVLYAGDDAGRYYYINNLQATPLSGFNNLAQIGTSREVTAVKVDPFSPATVWLGATSISAGISPAIMKVTSANTASPNVTVVSTISVPAGSWVSSIDINPNNANHLIATFSNYGITSVFQSTDGGSSWTSIEGNLPDMPVYWALFAPANAQLNGTGGGEGGVLLATELGVWSTSQLNGAATTWIPNSTGFPNVRTDMLKLRTSDYMLVAATHGRGLYTTTLPSIPLGLPTVSNTKNFIKSTLVNGQQLFISTGNLPLTKMQIRIFDMNGRLVHSADTRYSDQYVSIDKLAGSSYILKIYGTKGEQYTWQFVNRR